MSKTKSSQAVKALLALIDEKGTATLSECARILRMRPEAIIRLAPTSIETTLRRVDGSRLLKELEVRKQWTTDEASASLNLSCHTIRSEVRREPNLSYEKINDKTYIVYGEAQQKPQYDRLTSYLLSLESPPLLAVAASVLQCCERTIRRMASREGISIKDNRLILTEKYPLELPSLEEEIQAWVEEFGSTSSLSCSARFNISQDKAKQILTSLGYLQ